MPRVVRSFVASLALASALLSGPALGCGATPSESQSNREFDAVGTVRAIDVAHHTVTIAHEDVPGYMPAMTMPFELVGSDQVEGVAVGDRVEFRFRAAGGGRHVIVTITRR